MVHPSQAAVQSAAASQGTKTLLTDYYCNHNLIRLKFSVTRLVPISNPIVYCRLRSRLLRSGSAEGYCRSSYKGRTLKHTVGLDSLIRSSYSYFETQSAAKHQDRKGTAQLLWQLISGATGEPAGEWSALEPDREPPPLYSQYQLCWLVTLSLSFVAVFSGNTLFLNQHWSAGNSDSKRTLLLEVSNFHGRWYKWSCKNDQKDLIMGGF